ncbi:hypothetical protein R3P38DRAFT_2784858 [Favolaschia claudopus]|uniref:GH18 domain-containing protein n=1 Tax=Favolaschia claudopus TaxID=2862362 RepID=A0AAW0AVU9_9AGAR
MSVAVKWFGFCGTTDDFCGDGCQNNCGQPSIPSCDTEQQSALRRRIGYFEAWSYHRQLRTNGIPYYSTCLAFDPSTISAETLTHVNFAFALISRSEAASNPTLKVFLSIGGWTFNGLDVDWEYPAADDRGGVVADTKNYVSFLEAVKKAFSGPKYGLSFTAPSSYWYLQHFDLLGMMKWADWVNVMDIWIGPIVAAHTNLTEINEAFKLYWRAGVKPEQMVVGFGFYGRSFTLASPDCSEPGCIWASGADAGPCSDQSGILMWNEIQLILNKNDSSGNLPRLSNQWVSYDDAETFGMKMNYANEHCIGGSMIWAVDQDDQKFTVIPGIASASEGGKTENKCIITNCNVKSCGNGLKKYAGILYMGEAATRRPVIQHATPEKRHSQLKPAKVVEAGCSAALTIFNFPYIVWLMDAETNVSTRRRPSLPRSKKGETGSLAIFCEDVDKDCPPTCHDNACPLGQLLLTIDIQGDADKPCYGSATRSYCCDYNGQDTEPVPFHDIFPDDVPEESVSFQEEFDPISAQNRVLRGPGRAAACPTTRLKTTSRLGKSSSTRLRRIPSLRSSFIRIGVITSCHPTSDQAQSMPSNCGRGPFARVASLTVHPDQNILSKYHQSQKPASEPVYLLNFDYNFAAIPAANGPIYMRADVTDMPDYWDNVVESPPERKRWLKQRGLDPDRLDRRWWGSFKNWLNKMNTVEKDTSVSRNFHWSDTWTIFHKEVSCPGPPQFQASIDVSLSGQASLNSRYGFYLQATVVPPAVQAAYLYFFCLLWLPWALLPWTFNRRPQSRFIRIWRVLIHVVIIGNLSTLAVTGQLSVSGFSFGKTDPDDVSPSVSPGDVQSGVDLRAGYNVELQGDLSLHVVPAIQMGISVLGGAVIDAQAFVDVDLYGGVRINGSVSQSSAPEFCVAAYYGVSMDAGLTGEVLYWKTGPLAINFYKHEDEIYGKCFASVDESTVLDGRSIEREEISFIGGTIPEIQPSTSGAYIEQGNTTHRTRILPRSSPNLSSLAKRGVPSLPGLLNCPEVNDQIGNDGTDNDPYSDLNQNTLEDAFERRAINVDEPLFNDFDDEDEPLFNRTLCLSVRLSDSLVSISAEVLTRTNSQCFNSFRPLPYKNQGTAYYDLQYPTDTTFNPTFSAHSAPAPGSKAKGNAYHREHIYEVQLISDFISSLEKQTALWQSVNNNFCNWVQNEIRRPQVIPNLLHCLPFDARIQGTNPFMPWLEGVANGIKANVIHGNSIASAKRWRSYSFSKKLSVMRSTAGLAYYMTDASVRESFIGQSDCIKDVWDTWYLTYSTANNVQVNGGMQRLYTDFIRNVISQFSSRLDSGMNDMISFWDDAISKLDKTKPAPKVRIFT